jgi:uncharacterized membrane protein|tara:strand:- start:4671 stop:4874 length:204 start_codon:yes stop_codon:yes gene_type:complete
MFKETRTRSTKKSISWRIIAFSNSWMILVIGLSDIPLWNAIIMNATGMVMFYFHERFWNKIDDGRHT